MIPRIRAIAIDDEDLHLQAISRAATKAGFGCTPLLYPRDTALDELTALAFDKAHIRMIISDLHLNSGSQTSEKKANYQLIAGLIAQLSLSPWTPYVLVLWTQYPGDGDGLGEYLEERLDKHQLPGLILTLDKVEYNIPGENVNHEKLWMDLADRVRSSRGVNVLLEWEKEIIQAADNVVRKLLEVARGAKPKSVPFDEELDRVLSSIAQTATSKVFASLEPRAAANGGLLPVLIDEMEHLVLNPDQTARWTSALALAVAGQHTPPIEKEIALLNDALHVSKDGVATGADRGAVIPKWHDDAGFQLLFGVDAGTCFDTFALTKWPKNPSIKYLQIEGLCDSTQQKKGVVPFALACEVPGDTELKEKGRAASIEVSPVYLGADGSERKLIVNLRYFFTAERSLAKAQKADFRIRESMVSKWAFAWANHAIRPGTVEFHRAK